MKYEQRHPKSGERVVDNFPPSDPEQPFGVDGFRYWTEKDEYAPPIQVLCDCPWQPHPHYTTQAPAKDAD